MHPQCYFEHLMLMCIFFLFLSWFFFSPYWFPLFKNNFRYSKFMYMTYLNLNYIKFIKGKVLFTRDFSIL